MDWNNVSWWEVASALREVRQSRDQSKCCDTISMTFSAVCLQLQDHIKSQTHFKHLFSFYCILNGTTSGVVGRRSTPTAHALRWVYDQLLLLQRKAPEVWAAGRWNDRMTVELPFIRRKGPQLNDWTMLAQACRRNVQFLLLQRKSPIC